MDAPRFLTRIDAWACRSPISSPVSTSFGTMRDRPAVFVRIEDDAGCFGWGEIFANWPAAGAEHRVQLLVHDIAALVFPTPLHQPSDLFETLTPATHIRALQCGEFGPFRQVIAGLDQAVWDLFARADGVPVYRLLASDRSDAQGSVPAYASGLNLPVAQAMIDAARQRGFSRFKVKVGFDMAEDIAVVNELAGGLQPGEQLMADANQAWVPDQAVQFAHGVAGAGLGWLEEPIIADSPAAQWQALAKTVRDVGIPLAGGENLAGFDAFADAITAGALGIYQPDLAKWGGFTGCAQVARQAIDAGNRFCPHFLGGGIGLIASGHLLAAVGGDGMLEVDVNPNPLRSDFEAADSRVIGGRFELSDAPGLGVEALPKSVVDTVTMTESVHA